MFKILIRLLTVLLVSTFISVSAKAETVIRVVDWQSGVGGITNAYADFIKEFEAANPGVKVEYTQYTVTTYNEYLKPALSSGQGPDVFAVYPGPDVDEVVNAGHLVNITAEADDEWKSWLGKYQQSSTEWRLQQTGCLVLHSLQWQVVFILKVTDTWHYLLVGLVVMY